MQTDITFELQNTIISTIKQWMDCIPTVKCIKNKYILLKRKLRIDLPETRYNNRTLNDILNDTDLHDVTYWKNVLAIFKPIISVHYYTGYLGVFGSLEYEYVELINKLTEIEINKKSIILHDKIGRLENMIFAYSD